MRWAAHQLGHYLVAMARRAGVDLTLERFDELACETPVLADIHPGGRFLMLGPVAYNRVCDQ